ncbi:MAG: hypothetical protein BHW65_01415 [Verrucomicrobia bacterium CAG:312_58_20]|nr:MAG: hypothetical protein BHW65_01415 [Verrucomicrobia bacterium CAG:312_58_20]PWL68838.1 MAG: hypothetical protein DBY30_02115 [Verrucomicrobiota bacterium]
MKKILTAALFSAALIGLTACCSNWCGRGCPRGAPACPAAQSAACPCPAGKNAAVCPAGKACPAGQACPAACPAAPQNCPRAK